MENYICINGKKAELTEEQMKALGIELPKENPFDRVKKHKNYFYVDHYGEVMLTVECYTATDGYHYSCGNYCTDKAIMKQRALHEALNRLLWRYSMEHGGDKIDFQSDKDKWCIAYDQNYQDLKAYMFTSYHYIGAIYFNTKEIALGAIEEIIKPFMKAHPEFKF